MYKSNVNETRKILLFIGGIILCLQALENEVQTVLDLWWFDL